MRAFTTILITLSSFLCTAQEKNISWIAEKYIAALEAGDSTAEQYLIPIEGFELYDTTLYVHMFKSEAMVVVAHKINSTPIEKYAIKNLSYCIDLQENPRALVDRISNANVFMSKQNNKLLIEIIEKDKTVNLYFVDKHNNFSFKDFGVAKQYLNNLYK